MFDIIFHFLYFGIFSSLSLQNGIVMCLYWFVKFGITGLLFGIAFVTQNLQITGQLSIKGFVGVLCW